jgi:hypothetical protein
MYDISKKTYYKWRANDLGSVKYIGRREHPETKIKGSVRVLICEEKEKTNYGPLKMKLLIKRRLNIDVSTHKWYSQTHPSNYRFDKLNFLSYIQL